MQQVSSYILSLQGTNPANAKAPQGELWTPAENAAPTDSVAVAQPSDSAAVAVAQ
jgi:cytochrome c oxidase cbb3-type subunit 3